MEKIKRYQKLANLADIVRVASFGVAACNDYGFWQFVWGLESFYGCSEGYKYYKNNQIYFPKVLRFSAPKFTNIIAGLGSFAFAAGSLLTGDPKNALVYGSAGVGFMSNFLSHSFKIKAEDIKNRVDELENKNAKKIMRKFIEYKLNSHSLNKEINEVCFKPAYIFGLSLTDKWKLKRIDKNVNKLERRVDDLINKCTKEQNNIELIEKEKDEVVREINHVKQRLVSYKLSKIGLFQKLGKGIKIGSKALGRTMNIAFLSLLGYFAVNSWDTYKDYFQDKTKYANEQVTKDDIIMKFLEKSKQLEEAYIKGDDELIKEITKDMHLTKSKVENRLENLVECDLSLLTKGKVNISSSFDRSKCILLISKKYELGILNFYSFDVPIPGVQVNPYMYRRLTDFEKIALQDLGESMGLDAKRLPIDSKEFKELTALIRVNHYLGEEELKEKIKNKTNEIAMTLGLTLDQIKTNKETYSVYIAQIGGLTLNSPLLQIIRINDVQPSLKDLIFVYGHETGHAYFTQNSNFPESWENLFGIISGGEKLMIEETAADMVGELCTFEFAKNHLKQDMELFNEFLDDMLIPKGNENRYKIVETFKELSKEGKYNELKKYLGKCEKSSKEKTGKPYTPINSAMISIMQNYSGQRDISEKIKYIAYKLELKDFMKTIASLQTFEELDKVYNKLKD